MTEDYSKIQACFLDPIKELFGEIKNEETVVDELYLVASDFTEDELRDCARLVRDRHKGKTTPSPFQLKRALENYRSDKQATASTNKVFGRTDITRFNLGQKCIEHTKDKRGGAVFPIKSDQFRAWYLYRRDMGQNVSWMDKYIRDANDNSRWSAPEEYPWFFDANCAPFNVPERLDCERAFKTHPDERISDYEREQTLQRLGLIAQQKPKKQHAS